MKPRTLQSASAREEAVAAKKTDPPAAEKKPVTAPKMAFNMAFKPRQTISAAVKANIENQNAAAKQNALPQPTPDIARSNPLASQHAYSFEVHDPYDPAKPNDYIALCQERLDAKKRAQLDEDNAREMEARRREQQCVERERAEALAVGDMSRVQASMGRGRGRGNLSNLPAWMTGESKLGSPDESAADNQAPDGREMAKKNMTKMDFEDSGGLERSGQGISEPITASSGSAEHAVVPMSSINSTRMAETRAPDHNEKNITGVKRKSGFMNPSCVVLLKNMMAPGEASTAAARESLEMEIRDECSSKYGAVRSCLVKDISQSHQNLDPPEKECVRCFVCFEQQESAVKAFRDLNNRFFGGRQISASFFSEDRFRSADVAPSRGEW